jgi:hypothetical protein
MNTVNIIEIIWCVSAFGLTVTGLGALVVKLSYLAVPKVPKATSTESLGVCF